MNITSHYPLSMIFRTFPLFRTKAHYFALWHTFLHSGALLSHFGGTPLYNLLKYNTATTYEHCYISRW